MKKKALKKVAIGLLLIPLVVLLLFTFGEVFSGDVSGLSHLIQAAPLLLFAYLAYKKPFAGGLSLLIVGFFLGILYPLKVPFDVVTIIIVEIFLFVPPFVSGILFILSSNK